MTSADILKIYDEEMRQRVTKLRLALSLVGSIDAKSRAAALYDAHLQAHTIKGTSEQLGFAEVALLASRMVEALEAAREAGSLASSAATGIDRGANAIIAWLDGGRKTIRPLTIATAAFALGDT